MKRPLLFRLFNLLMTVVVLTTSTGFGLVERTCLMRGQKTYTLTKAEAKPACANCPDQKLPKKTTSLRKDKCCDDRDVYEHVTFTQSLVQWMAKVVKTIGEAVVNASVWLADRLVQGLLALDSPSSSLSSSAAVPLAGRSLLQFIQTFLI